LRKDVDVVEHVLCPNVGRLVVVLVVLVALRQVFAVIAPRYILQWGYTTHASGYVNSGANARSA
jgi:hypothetical protein